MEITFTRVKVCDILLIIRFPGFVNFIWKVQKRQNDMLFILPYFMNTTLKNIVQINEIYLQN